MQSVATALVPSDDSPRTLLRGADELPRRRARPALARQPGQGAQPPRCLDSRYRLGELLGRGAMGCVHLGRQLRLGRSVAVKSLREDLSGSRVARRRLEREARVLGRIRSPHVVQVHDTGRTEDGAPYLVMEYVDGCGPGEILEVCTRVEPILDAFDGLLAALEASHRCGVVHRDIKPTNMILRGCDPSQLVLLDFGIAASQDEQPTARLGLRAPGSEENAAGSITGEGAVLGTPLYMAPEQARGLGATERSDLYSAAVVLYRWLSGRPPFQGSAREVMRAHAFEPLPPLQPRPGLVLPASLVKLVDRALAKDPAARWASASELRTALREVREGRPRSKRPAKLRLVRSEDEHRLEPASPEVEIECTLTVPVSTPAPLEGPGSRSTFGLVPAAPPSLPSVAAFAGPGLELPAAPAARGSFAVPRPATRVGRSAARGAGGRRRALRAAPRGGLGAARRPGLRRGPLGPARLGLTRVGAAAPSRAVRSTRPASPRGSRRWSRVPRGDPGCCSGR